MLRRLLFAFLILISTSLFAQHSYTILYERSFNILSDTSKGEYSFDQSHTLTLELSINGSRAYYKPLIPNKTNYKENPLGKEFSSHCMYKNLLDSTTITGYYVDEGHFYRVKNTLLFKKWELFPDTKIIAGFTCMKAMIKHEKYTEVAWYASEITTSFGTWLDDGLPGGVLEFLILYPNGNFIKTVAKSVKNSSKEIIEPIKGKLITQDEFNKILKRIKKWS